MVRFHTQYFKIFPGYFKIEFKHVILDRTGQNSFLKFTCSEWHTLFWNRSFQVPIDFTN